MKRVTNIIIVLVVALIQALFEMIIEVDEQFDESIKYRSNNIGEIEPGDLYGDIDNTSYFSKLSI